MNRDTAIRISAGMGFLAVALGAFGAHGLKDVLEHNQTAGVWDKAVFYHFIHTVVLFLVAVRPRFAFGLWCTFLAGIVLFSGSLYVLAVTGLKWLGAITPLGGLSFLAGWLWVVIRPKSSPQE